MDASFPVSGNLARRVAVDSRSFVFVFQRQMDAGGPDI
jgi:hypothetical protein